MHRQVQRAGRVALLGLVLALGVTALPGRLGRLRPSPDGPAERNPHAGPRHDDRRHRRRRRTRQRHHRDAVRVSLDEACPSTPLKYTGGRHDATYTMSRR